MTRAKEVPMTGLFALTTFFAFAQSPAPKFEVASIRPVKDCGFPGGPPGDGKKSGPGPGALPAPPPDRLNMCGPVMMFINVAYIVQQGKPTQANSGLRLVPDIPIEGGPDWIRSDNYTINAKAEAPASRDTMTGPMLQALLVERFNLRIRREQKDGPAYAITVAKGGPKLTPSTCLPGFFPGGPEPPPGRVPCPMNFPVRHGLTMAIDRDAMNLDEFAQVLGLDRPVVNRTGIAGVYDFHLEFAPDETTPLFRGRIQDLPDSNPDGAPADPAGGPSIFTAFQEQLGLKLDPTRAPHEVLVIDSVERPSEN